MHALWAADSCLCSHCPDSADPEMPPQMAAGESRRQEVPLGVIEVACSVFQEVERHGGKGGLKEQGHLAVHVKSFSLKFFFF